MPPCPPPQCTPHPPQQDKTLTMSALRTDIEGGTTRYSTTNNSVYSKVRSKMAAKYGQFSHGVTWKKSWWPW